ncbi:MAG TPA: pitrilysin family protein [Ferruginibacter sp.]|nr:pitrilysin family protein [Ferruginibacter sp.]HMP19526.1 pitrilysin family protein [Ferruginibacter sp.]
MKHTFNYIQKHKALQGCSFITLIFILVGIFFIQPATAQTKKIDRTKRPVAGPAPVVTIKEPAQFNLPNGMTVLVVENHKLPRVRATLNIDFGPVKEGDKAGLLDLMGNMLSEGTTSMPKDAFDEAVDIIGADVNLNAGGGTVSALTRYFDKAFSLMADAVRNPAFTQESFDKLKSMTLTGLKANEKSAPAIADRVYEALSHGKQTALGEFTTEETVKKLTLADVKDAYNNYITPSRSYLIFVGDITPAAAKALAEKAFGSWKGKQLSLPVIPPVENPGRTEINFVDMPTAVQGELRIGNLVNNPMNNKDYHALLLANHILGGGSESKLYTNLREKHGFTYGSYSKVGSGRFQNTFTASAAVRTDKVDSATAELFKEILNMRDGNITAEELSNAKAKYNGAFAIGMEDPARTAEYAYTILINSLPKDFYSTYLQKINAVTLDEIKAVSKNYFSESNSRIVIVGNAAKIIPKLMRLGYPIKKYDRFAEPVPDKPVEVNAGETNKTTDNISAYEIIESYLKAVGGKEAIKNVNTITATISLDMMGRSFEGVDKRMNPNKQFTELKMGSMTIMKRVFDGKQGYMQQGPQKKEFNEQEIKEALDEKGVIPQLFYMTDAGYKTDYLGTGNTNGEATYRLKVTMPSGKVSIQEYAVKTGLLLKEESVTVIQEQEIAEVVEYKDYTKAGPLLLPAEITRNTGGQEFTIKLSGFKINEGVTENDFK